MREDLIDFPCSDTFLDAFHQQGLTPRHSPDFHRADRRFLELIDRQNELLERLTERIGLEPRPPQPIATEYQSVPKKDKSFTP